jgi:uncharacterized protein YbjT (DUF2867 family)
MRAGKMYLVTGATGNVGSEVVEQLLAGGQRVRVFTRDAAKVARWIDRVEVAVGSFADSDSFARAAAGVEGVFLMNGGPEGEPFARLIAAAKSQGSQRIVFLSTLLAGDPSSPIGAMHKDKEDAIRSSGLQGKFVRAGGFMSNSYQWIGSIKADGVVNNSMGTGRFAPIAPEDIAAVAVKALTTSGLADEIFEVTGGELISVPEEVSILAEVLGRPLRCVDVPTETAVQGLIQSGVPPHVAAAVGKSFEAIRDGRAMIVKDTVAQVTGRQPMVFAEWARRHAARFA